MDDIFAPCIALSPNMLAIVDMDGTFLHTNAAWEDVLGFSQSQLHCRSVINLQHPQDRDTFVRLMRPQAGRTDASTFRTRCLCQDGTYRWLEWTLSASVCKQVYVNARDIHQQTQDEARIRKSEERLEEAQRIARLGSWEYDLATKKITWSKELFRLMEMDPADGEPDYEGALSRYERSDAERLHQSVHIAITAGIPYELELRRVQADGSFQWYQAMGNPLRNEAGKVVRLIGVLLDITERKRATQLLDEQTSLYSSVVNNLKEVVFQTDANGLWTFLNPAWTEITGFDLEASLGTSFLDYVHFADREYNQSLFAHLIAREKEYCRHEIRYITRDGGFRWIEVFARLTLDTEGNVIGASGTLNDVTQRRTATEELRKSEQLKASILESALDCIITMDHEGRILEFNPAAERTFGYTCQEAIGTPLHDLIVPARLQKAHQDGMTRFLATGEGPALYKRIEVPAVRADGTEFPVELAAVPIFVGEHPVFTAYLRDLSEQKKAEAALQKARDQEVEIGANIQQSLLLGQPPDDLPGIQMSAYTVASQRIDGDFYDFFTYDTYRFDVILGDVMGKGISAALLGAATKNEFLRSMNGLLSVSAIGRVPSPEEIVMGVHTNLTPQLIELETFVTLCYVRFEVNKQQIQFIDCGHTKIIHYQRRNRSCAFLNGENTPLGFCAGEVYAAVTVPFEEGDIFVFYSDGVTEAQNNHGDFFGVDRLADCIADSAGMTPETIIQIVRGAVIGFTQTLDLIDDFTCVAVKIVGPQNQENAHAI